MHKLHMKWVELMPWLAAVSVALTLSWAADGIRDLVEAWAKGETVKGWMMITHSIYVILFIAATVWLYRMRTMIFQPRTRLLSTEVPEKRAHLVVFLSNLNVRQFPDGVPGGITFSGDLDEDLVSLVAWKQERSQYWPWELPLRGIRHHLGALQTLTILCSRESILQVHWFSRLLTHYRSMDSVTVQVLVEQGSDPPALVDCSKEMMTQGGWDFERFDELSRAMMQLLREFKKQGVADNQVMIDFTGGQKVTGVIAASVTFNRAIKAHYVQTNSPYRVFSYDIFMASSETSGLGL